MNISRGLTHILSVVVASAALSAVPGPPVSASTAAPPSGHARHLDVDTDGDGLGDTVDGCPTVASANPTGCPTASRTVQLTWLDGKQRLQARVDSPVAGCRSGARVVLWRVRAGGSTRLGSRDASFRGRVRFAAPRRARYYVTVPPSYSPGTAECAGATSRKVSAR
jgi:hypothetical protein